MVVGSRIWRSHGCSSEHESMQGFLACRIPGLVHVYGDAGPYAVVSWCLPAATVVSLHGDLDGVERTWEYLVAHGCGTGCVSKHQAVQIDLPKQNAAP